MLLRETHAEKFPVNVGISTQRFRIVGVVDEQNH